MNLSEFRKDISNQFTKALQGPIQVERGGVVFELRNIGSKTVREEVKETTEKIKANFANTPMEMVKAISKVQNDPHFRGAMKFCKEGHPIPEGRSRCLGKGCKYA